MLNIKYEYTRRRKGKWQLVIVLLDETTGRKIERTRMTDVRSREKSEEGRQAALDLMPAFREELERTLCGKAPIPSPSTLAVLPIRESLGIYTEYRYLAGEIKQKTAKGYLCYLHHLEPLLDKSASQIGVDEIVEWVATALQRGSSRKCVKGAHSLLSSLYSYLMRFHESGITDNPLRSVHPPKYRQAPPNPLNRDSIVKLNRQLHDMCDCELRRAVLIALNMGLRVGEVCALLWREIDLENGYATIMQQSSESDEGGYESASLKNSWWRVVPFTPLIFWCLKRWHDCDVSRFAAAGYRHPEEAIADRPVLTTVRVDDSGMPCNKNAVSKRFSTLSLVVGLSGVRSDSVCFHSLRHTFATQWVANGGDMSALSHILGHKSTAFTMSVYVGYDRLAIANGITSCAPALASGWPSAPEAYDSPWYTRGATVPLQVPVEVLRGLSQVAQSIGVSASELALTILDRLSEDGAQGVIKELFPDLFAA